jgi:putative SOS response-associated peptidase YedK
LLKPFPAKEMRAYPVSSDVGNVNNDSPECVMEIPLLL